jgi:glutathione peroxidase
MKIPYSILMFLASTIGIKGEVKSRPENIQADTAAFYNFKMVTLEGDTVDFASFRGKKVLIVNTASKCGYTPQYDELQKFHEKYGDKVIVLGFPCNQFGGQEPGTHEDIKEFCKKNYGVTFRMFEKINVKGSEKHPLFDWLSNKDKNGWNTKEPGWNFCKYLINEKGELVNFYASGVSPMSEEIIKAIK